VLDRICELAFFGLTRSPEFAELADKYRQIAKISDSPERLYDELQDRAFRAAVFGAVWRAPSAAAARTVEEYIVTDASLDFTGDERKMLAHLARDWSRSH
jgi:hypothetical protein